MKYYVLIICLFSSISLYAKLREIPVKLSLATMFAPDISYTTGIKGSVNAGGKIDIKIRGEKRCVSKFGRSENI